MNSLAFAVWADKSTLHGWDCQPQTFHFPSITLTNSSNIAEIQCFFAASASATDSPLKATAAPNEVVTSSAAKLGWASGNAILIIKNAGTVTAEFEIEFAEV